MRAWLIAVWLVIAMLLSMGASKAEGLENCGLCVMDGNTIVVSHSRERHQKKADSDSQAGT